jgi:fumarate reductase flavoprotein subunit
MQVISTEGKPIPGLYAGFHTAGGESGESVLNGLPFGSMYGSNLLSYVGGWMAADGISANES